MRGGDDLSTEFFWCRSWQSIWICLVRSGKLDCQLYEERLVITIELGRCRWPMLRSWIVTWAKEVYKWWQPWHDIRLSLARYRIVTKFSEITSGGAPSNRTTCQIRVWKTRNLEVEFRRWENMQWLECTHPRRRWKDWLEIADIKLHWGDVSIYVHLLHFVEGFQHKYAHGLCSAHERKVVFYLTKILACYQYVNDKLNMKIDFWLEGRYVSGKC